jgi:Flp pilus assembly CpaF family ATPase
MPNKHKSEFQQLVDQAMSQTPNIVTIGEIKGDKATTLALATDHATYISSFEDLNKLGKRLYGCR